MKHLLHFLLILYSLISFCYSCYGQEKIVLSTYEWPPEQSATLPHYGGVLHIVTEVFSNAGIEIEWKWYPTTRAEVMAMKGKVDGLATMGYSKKRADAMHTSDIVISAVTRFYHLKSFKLEWEKMTDLKGINGRVGITGRYNYGDEFNAAVSNNVFKVEKAVTDIMNFKKLLAGRIVTFPMTTGIAEHMIITQLKPGSLEKITYHPKAVRAFDSYLYLAKSRETGKKYLDIFNQELKKLKDNGRYGEIIAAYERGEYSKPK